MNKVKELRKTVSELRDELKTEYEDTKKRIGKNIRTLRHEWGMNQDHLGDLIGKARSQIANIETGRAPISLKDLISVCDIFDVTPNDILLKK